MKDIIILTIIFLALLTAMVYSQTYSNITYDAGTSLEIQVGADVCANDIFINGTYSGGGTICTGPLPVELISFTYSVNKRNIILNWETAFEINNSGFEIQRINNIDQKTNSWSTISFVQGNGTTNEPKRYSYEDKKLGAGKYKYRLKQVDYNGSFEYYTLNEEVSINPPKEFFVSQNYPNPSNPKSKIDYEIPVSGKVTLKIYDILGREVIQIVNEVKEAGYYTAEFDGTNLASGVYFYRLISEGQGQKFTKTLKMLIIK